MLHKRLQRQIEGLTEKQRQLTGAFTTAFRKLTADPLNAGEPIKGVVQPGLAGRVRKLHVGGRRGYRLLYFVPEQPPALAFCPVIPLFISDVPRGRFDYGSIDPNAIGQDILDDFRSGNYGSFVVPSAGS